MSDHLDYIQAENGLGKLACYQAEKGANILEFIKKNQKELQIQLYQHGGILLRNFNIRAVSEFSCLAETISPNLLDYVNRSTPRTKLGGKIYTATEYPISFNITKILIHNLGQIKSCFFV